MEKSPYQEALDFIQQHPGTGSSKGMARLILSLWNETCSFSLRECARAFDADRDALALRVIQHFFKVGEDAELTRVGHAVNEYYPRMWEVTRVMNDARNEQMQLWEKQDQAEWEAQERAAGRDPNA